MNTHKKSKIKVALIFQTRFNPIAVKGTTVTLTSTERVNGEV